MINGEFQYFAHDFYQISSLLNYILLNATFSLFSTGFTNGHTKKIKVLILNICVHDFFFLPRVDLLQQETVNIPECLLSFTKELNLISRLSVLLSLLASDTFQ